MTTSDAPQISINPNAPLDILYQALFEPMALYDRIAAQWPHGSVHLLYATFIVAGVSSLGRLLEGSIKTFDAGTVLSAMVAGLYGLGAWLLTGIVIAATAYCFRSSGRLAVLMTLLGYSVLPWILLAPLFSFRVSLGLLGQLTFFFGILALWAWTTVLFVLALKKTYHLSVDRALLLGALPSLFSLLHIVWSLSQVSSFFTLFS